jgi:hypothetical protein
MRPFVRTLGRFALAGTLTLLLAASAQFARHRTRTAPTARELLDRAIERAGGSSALTRSPALLWAGEATVHAGAREVHIKGDWSILPPDSAVVDTYDVTQGEATRRSLIVAAPRGWVMRGRDFTPLPAPVLANERDEFYLYSVMRLVTLRAPGVRLSLIPDDSAGARGFRAEQNGRPPVDVYVDSAGRMSHLRATIADPNGGSTVREELWFTGVIEDAGVRWPREIRITLAGAPYFDLTVTRFKAQPSLRDPRLLGPLP